MNRLLMSKPGHLHLPQHKRAAVESDQPPVFVYELWNKIKEAIFVI